MQKAVICDECGEVILTKRELEACLGNKEIATSAHCSKCGHVVKVLLPSKKADGTEYCKKSIACPVCGSERLIDTAVDTRSELMEESKMPSGWNPDYFQKCWRCKKEIGNKKIS